MFPKYPEFKVLQLDDKDTYNKFYRLLKKPNSDYCFSVIFSWLNLDEEVEVSQIGKDLIILKYIDVLDKNSHQIYFAPIGTNLSHEDISLLVDIKSNDPTSKVIVVESLKEDLHGLKVEEKIELSKDEDLCDYVYSVDEYASLNHSNYRRIRREINLFKRDYEYELSLRETGPTNKDVINSHHMWDDTFKYNNDPDRLEGIAMSRIINRADQLDLRCVLCEVNNVPEGFLLFTINITADGKKYADLHHARFSYRYRYINDYAFHKFAQFLQQEKIDFINFERDAGIEGLREHKKLLKPVQMIDAYELTIKH